MKPMKKTIRVRPHKMSIAAPVSAKIEYDKDFFKWTKTQASLLKKGHLDELDIDNLKEEIESLGRNDKKSLRSHVIVLLMHMLKQKYQPEGQGNSNSWDSSIQNATMEVKFLLKDSPSLKNELRKLYHEAYEASRERASFETQLPLKTFPKECPWEMEEILPFIKKKKG
jgi:hypothetical protein